MQPKNVRELVLVNFKSKCSACWLAPTVCVIVKSSLISPWLSGSRPGLPGTGCWHQVTPAADIDPVPSDFRLSQLRGSEVMLTPENKSAPLTSEGIILWSGFQRMKQVHGIYQRPALITARPNFHHRQQLQTRSTDPSRLATAWFSPPNATRLTEGSTLLGSGINHNRRN